MSGQLAGKDGGAPRLNQEPLKVRCGPADLKDAIRNGLVVSGGAQRSSSARHSFSYSRRSGALRSGVTDLAFSLDSPANRKTLPPIHGMETKIQRRDPGWDWFHAISALLVERLG